jgi:hypothetical protein
MRASSAFILHCRCIGIMLPSMLYHQVDDAQAAHDLDVEHAHRPPILQCDALIGCLCAPSDQSAKGTAKCRNSLLVINFILKAGQIVANGKRKGRNRRAVTFITGRTRCR